MIYLGSERVITNTFSNHITAEDYAGSHLSPVSINGSGKVIKIINKFTSHDDSINYNTYLNNRNNWKDGNYYNCISITGKNVRMRYDELGGNQVYIETMANNEKITLRFAHLDSVLVNVGDIIKENQIFAYQGNTGLVLSNKSTSDITYGSHVHLEVTDRNGNYLNPRNYALGNIPLSYIEQTNIVDTNKKQFQVIVDQINIRELPNVESRDIGDVYIGEVYTILEEIDSEVHTWYRILTSNGISGYVASRKDSNWIKILDIGNDTSEVPNMDTPITENIEDEYTLLFECQKEGYYYLKLYENEKLYLKKNA